MSKQITKIHKGLPANWGDLRKKVFSLNAGDMMEVPYEKYAALKQVVFKFNKENIDKRIAIRTKIKGQVLNVIRMY